jgi:putative transposase
VRDAFSNKVVGWATDARADTELVLTALNHALRSRNIQDGQLVHHSDKGCQYTALRFTQRLADAGVAPSTGSVGDSYDTQSSMVVRNVARGPDSSFEWPRAWSGVRAP